MFCLFTFSYFFLLQLENLTNFIKAITTYGLKPHDTFEANDLFENGNMTQVQTTLLALAGMVSPVESYNFAGEQPIFDISVCNYRLSVCLQAKTKGTHSSVDIGVKYAERQERAFDEEKMKAGQCVIGLQVWVNFHMTVLVIIWNYLNMSHNYFQFVIQNWFGLTWKVPWQCLLLNCISFNRWEQINVQVKLEWMPMAPEDICMIPSHTFYHQWTIQPSVCRWAPTSVLAK